MVHDGHVGIPFYVGYFGVFCHEIIYHVKNEVLHLGIAHVEHQLCSASSGHGFASGGFYNPVGMFFVEFAYGIGHFGFDPYSEFDFVFLCVAQ